MKRIYKSSEVYLMKGNNMFVFHFLLSNAAVSVMIITILCIRKFSMYKTRADINCKIWLLLIALMIFAFIPDININFGSTVDFSSQIHDNIFYESSVTAVKDIYTVQYRYNMNILLLIWFTGMFISFVFMLKGYADISLRLGACQKPDADSEKIFLYCKEKTGVKAILLISDEYCAPFSFGIFRKYVVVPEYVFHMLNKKELKYILFHELIHHKHRDNLYSLIMNILECAYWFNPFVHTAFHRIRADMEMYCDSDVLRFSELGSPYEYGSTILNFIQYSKGIFKENISGTGIELKDRIIRIMCSKNSKKAELTAICLALAAAVFSFGITSAFGYSSGNVYRKDISFEALELSDEFAGTEGCFVLYDGKSYKIYNKEMAFKRFSPNSTYKPVIALNALENNIITTSDTYMKWDGKKYPFNEWMSDQTLNTAMANSVNWYFQKLDEKLDHSSFVRKINYGNEFTGTDKENYWLGNSLRISAVEQVNLLKDIYYNKYGFNSENIEAVKNSIRLGSGFYGKTGTGNINGRLSSGWFIGFCENNKNTEFYALYMKGNVKGADAYNKTLAILDKIKEVSQ